MVSSLPQRIRGAKRRGRTFVLARTTQRRIASGRLPLTWAPITAAGVALRWRGRPPAANVTVYAVYTSKRAPILERLLDDAHVTAALWALDEPSPALASRTLGTGQGDKWDLVNRLWQVSPPAPGQWIAVLDDDAQLGRGGLAALIDIATRAHFDLCAPAQTHLSWHSHQWTVAQRGMIARSTTRIECGPVVLIHPEFVAQVLPAPAGSGMGWTLEIDWNLLARRGARLGIIDALPVRHLHPVGQSYNTAEHADQFRVRMAQAGLTDVGDLYQCRGTWPMTKRQPSWISQTSRKSAPQTGR